MRFEYAAGATPIDADEALGLIPSHIATQADLNTWEEANIVDGTRWITQQKIASNLNETLLRNLHRHMFNKTWRWAGTFRNSNKNIGVDWQQISLELRNLLDNTTYQIKHQTMTEDEIALRFHHRLVWIHAFPNGNGRHARLITDALISDLGGEKFSWGEKRWGATSITRQNYLSALRAADYGHFESLREFLRQ